MYRCAGDEAISYTAEDLLLFKESPFASWMERLTLENPRHGIASDQPGNSMGNYCSASELLDNDSALSSKHCVEAVQWGDLAQRRTQPNIQEPRIRHRLAGLVDVGDDIYVVKKMDDIRRRQETLDAMRSGVSIIVNAQLWVGPLSGDVDLLMRSSGVSELGNYLYIPCDISERERPNCALALCFSADLLHSMQGVLPSHMLAIRSGGNLLNLKTEDHIYHYRAVKQSFMTAQRSFRSHCMPNPEDSASFGRWSRCANDAMKRRSKFPSDEVSAVKHFDAPSVQLRSVANFSANDSYVDLDWPGKRRNLSEQHIFNDTLMTSTGTDV